MKSEFDGNTLQFIGYSLLGSIITILTFGILGPLSLKMMIKWAISHTKISGTRLVFDGTAWQIFWFGLKILLLCIITLGIYGIFVPVKCIRFLVEHTRKEYDLEDDDFLMQSDNNIYA